MPGRAPAMGNVPDIVRRPGLLLLFCLGSCRPAAPTAAPHDEIPVAPPPAAEFEGVAWTQVELERLPALVTLPDARGWRARPNSTFVILEHGATQSRLVLRVWRAARLVRPAECEAEARLARPALPVLDPATRIEERALTVPSGFDVRLQVAARPGEGASVVGSALAIGAGVGRCYLAAYETVADGPHAAELVADRLSGVVQGIFETIQVESADGRVPPPPGVK